MYTNSVSRQWSWHLSNYVCAPSLIVTLHPPRELNVEANSLGCAIQPTHNIDYYDHEDEICGDNCTSATKYDSTIKQCVLCPVGKFATGVGALDCTEDEGIYIWRMCKYIVICYYLFKWKRIVCISDCVWIKRLRYRWILDKYFKRPLIMYDSCILLYIYTHISMVCV